MIVFQLRKANCRKLLGVFYKSEAVPKLSVVVGTYNGTWHIDTDLQLGLLTTIVRVAYNDLQSVREALVGIL